MKQSPPKKEKCVSICKFIRRMTVLFLFVCVISFRILKILIPNTLQVIATDLGFVQKIANPSFIRMEYTGIYNLI